MSDLLETFVSYVPALVARRYVADPAPLSAPVVERFPAAVFFADITGFTALTEQLAQRGPAGAEELGSLLNTYFGQLIALIGEHGGEVVKFAGDGLLALWPAEVLQEGLPTVTRRAVQCGLAVQRQLDGYQSVTGVRLTQRVGIGAGEVFTAHLGGVFGRWELLVAGDPLLQVSKAEQEAQPGQVALSPEAWDLTHGAFTGHRLPLGAVRIETATTLLPPRHAVLPALMAQSEPALRAYIPGAILSRLSAGQTGWLAESRRVTILFINLPDLNYAASVEQAQMVMRVLQTSLYRYEGSINKFSVDDKGVTLVAALGLPPLAHEDDAARGAQAALLLQASLRELGLRSAVGITTGRAFCGSVGGSTRREYTMVGDVVNLAARLMQAAPGDILCDAATAEAAQQQIVFDTLPPIMVKGKAEQVAVYRPRGPVRGMAAANIQTATVGRMAERTILLGQLQALRDGAPGGVLVIEGEAGIGKSHLARDLARQAERLHLTAFEGHADATERATPYFAWREVFNQLLDLRLLTDPEARRRQTLDLLEDDPDLLRFAPLLNPVLLIDLPDNDDTAGMSGEMRADATRDFLLKLLQTAAARSPKTVVLENAQWLDSASWALALAASRQVSPLLLVIVTRPLTAPVPAEFQQLLERETAWRLRVAELPPEEAVALVAQRLGVHALPKPVARLIRERAEGNPFFSEQLAYSLRDAGLLRIADGECRLAPEAGDLRTLHLPDTVQGVITSRIDRLTPPQQLTLKVASVIGRAFPYRILADIYPLEQDRAHLPEYLRALQDLDLIVVSTPEPDLTFSFRNTVTLEVAYNLMLFAQRRDLHRIVAKWHERIYVDDLSPFFPLLAHHWSIAENIPAAVHYLERAGEMALRGYANQEAIGFFHEVLRWDAERERLGPTPDAGAGERRIQRARWERQIGQAYYGAGNLQEGRRHLQTAAVLLGHPPPAIRLSIFLALMLEVVRQAVHQLLPSRFIGKGRERRAALLESARVHALLGEICYFTTEIALGIYHTIAALNRSESAGLSPELARAYANMTIAAGMVPLRSQAESYSQRARSIASELEHLPVAAQVYWVTGVYAAGAGEWDQARTMLAHSTDLADRLGDRLQGVITHGVAGMVLHYQNRYAEAAQLNAGLYALAVRTANAQQQAWVLCSHADNALRLGKLEEAAALIERALPLVERDIRRAAAIRAYGVMAAVCLRLDQPRLARQAADQLMRTVGNASPTVYSGLEGYAGATETYLALWEAGGDQPGEQQALADGARRAVKMMQRYAQLFPVGEPRALLLQGQYAWLTGKQRQARNAWARGIAAAERLGMPCEQALAHYELGRHAEGEQRRTHLATALELFRRTDAAWDVERTQAALADSGAVPLAVR